MVNIKSKEIEQGTVTQIDWAAISIPSSGEYIQVAVSMQDSNGSNLTTKTLTLTGLVSEGNISLQAITNAILSGLDLEEEN